MLVRLYAIDVDLHQLPDLAPDQKPNEVLVIPTIKLADGEFGTQKDRFITDVDGWLNVPADRSYQFQLRSDDGGRLWIDDQLVIDHDGLHGPTAKVGDIKLTAGPHRIHAMQFDSGGGEMLQVEWAATEGGAFELLPAAALSHDKDAPRDTAPGAKRVIPGLRRGRPGDGAPIKSMHPYFGFAASGVDKHPTPRTLEGTPYAKLTVLTAPTASAAAPYVWFPPDESAAGVINMTPIQGGPYDGHILLAGSRRPGIYRLVMDHVGDTWQGAIMRFGNGLDGPVRSFAVTEDDWIQVRVANTAESEGDPKSFVYLQPRRRTPFEISAVHALSNGLTLELAQPLDDRAGWDSDGYYIEQWPYDLAAGKAPRRDGVAYAVKSASVAADRKSVFLEMDGLRPSSIVYIRLRAPSFSEAGELPWTTEAWYTLASLPKDRKGEVRPRPAAPPQNLLTPEEQAAGWKLLFDGKTTNGWRGFQKPEIPSGWQVVDGCLTRTGGGGDIVTVDQYDSFELSLEWRISQGGNSGIIYRVSEEPPNKYPWETGPEMQVLDNAEHADGASPLTSAGSDYALYPPPKDVTRHVGLFNEAKIIVRGDHVEHWLNGEKLLEYELGSDEWKRRVKLSKFNDMPRYGTAKRGFIALQDHGDKVWFRNIKILELK